MNEIIKYIIGFLLGEECNELYCNMVGYTSNVEEFCKYRIVIRPSGFFDSDVYGTDKSVPVLPLSEIDGVPLLFGNSGSGKYFNTLVVEADIVAGTFFVLSRYEEFLMRDIRDKHGRFPGCKSLLFRIGWLGRPLVDEYGRILRMWFEQVGIFLPPNKGYISKVWLTHDIDAPFFCRSFRNFVRETVKGCGFFKALSYCSGNLEDDPFYTFPWILEKDHVLKEIFGERCESLFFVKSGGRDVYDKPFYGISSPDVVSMISLLKKNGAMIGLHSSYESGRKTELIASEKERLEKEWGINSVKFNRNHFLRSCEPENFTALMDAGITDDFTMGYADISGFRLGTSRPVKWIDPVNMKLTDLVLHPLLVMDCTLSDAQYMGMTMDEAFEYCMELFSQVKLHGGEISLLWHNTSFVLNNDSRFDHRQLYSRLIDSLCKMYC